MKKLTPEDPQTHSADVVAENVEHLRELFPEAFTEGRVDFDVLKQLLSGVLDEREEKYGLNWHGKRRARQLALTPSTGTLRPCPEESVDWDTTQNLMIEGDNLEVLKLLQKSYAGKVKLIYIDPPYNTGKDFVYPDNFRDSIHNYLEITAQVDGENGRVSSNTEASGRFHTDWLNMMFPRLKLARNLLSEDGVLLISIDEVELANLLNACPEIFGDENYCGTFVWEKKKKPSFLSANMGCVTDYIVCYARRREMSPPFTAGAVEEGKKYPFNNAGNGIQTLTFAAGSVSFSCPDQHVQAQDMSEGNIKTELLDDMEIRAGRNSTAFRLRGEWRYSQQKLDRFVEEGAELLISKIPFRPNYINRSGESKKTANLLSHRTNGVPTNEDATGEIRRLFGSDVMTYPKPSGLLRYLVESVTRDGDLVMDFFAGSGTTAHGLWLAGAQDGLQRRFILVQLPEPLHSDNTAQLPAVEFCDRLGIPRNIAELTKERLRRAAKEIKADTPLLAGDLGFRVFKLDRSNIRAWDPSPHDLEGALFDSVEHIRDGRTEQDVLYELVLKLGLALCVPMEERPIAGKSVYSIGAGTLFACMAKPLALNEVEELGLGITSWHDELNPAGETTVVFRDSAFVDDVAKSNLAAILEQHGMTNVRSL